MAAYIIAQVEVTDPETFESYREQVPAAIAKHGGRYIVRGGATETIEGDWAPARLVVIEFPDVTAAKGFYESPEYQKIIGLRLQSAKSSLIVVEGYTPPEWQPPL